jgi:hypothetical protein
MDERLIGHEAAHVFGIYEDRYNERGVPKHSSYMEYITAWANGLDKPASAEIEEVIDLARERDQIQMLMRLPIILRDD